MVEITEHTRNVLLEVAKKKKIYVEGNFLKILKAPKGDTEFEEYLKICKEKDVSTRRKRLEVTKQVQEQNKETERLNNELVNKLALFKVSLNMAFAALKSHIKENVVVFDLITEMETMIETND